jgi:DNA polymerase-3 subunit beta
MKFSISRENFLKPLSQIIGVVERRQTMPVLSNVLMVTQDDALTLTTTDMEIEMTASTELDSVESGRITVPARKLYDICRALPEQANIEFSVDNEKQRALIRSGKSRFNLTTLPAEEFPSLEEIKSEFRIEIGQDDFKYLIDKTQFAMAQQDVRYYLNGLLLEVDNGTLRAVATDGHRLAFCESDVDVQAEQVRQVILPRKGVVELSKILDTSSDTVEIELSANHVRIKQTNMQFTSKLVDGKFPDYRRVIPKDGSNVLVAERDAIKQALARASILSNEKYRGIRLTIMNNTLQAQAHNPEMEEAEEEVEVQYQGDDIVIGFNVNYLLDAVSAIDTENVNMAFSDANSSCLVTPEKDEDRCIYVIMPMRL